MKLSKQIRKALPVLVATSVLTACVGGQEGDTNGEFAGVGGIGGLSGGAVTTLGVIGGVVLAGALLANDDSDDATDTAVGGTGGTAGGDAVTGGDTTVGAGDTTVGTGDTGTGDTGTGDTGTGDTGTGDTGTGDTGTGDTDTGDTGTGDTGTGDTGTGDTGTGDTGTGDTGTGDTGTGDTGTGGTVSNTLTFAPDGTLTGQFFSDEALPANNAGGDGTADLMFDTTAGMVTGCVTIPAGMTPAPQSGADVSTVSVMIGPPGANGFPGLELEPNNAERTEWCVPANLSVAQMGIIQQNLPSGNLYLAARNNNFPNGQIRGQITPPGVYRYSTTVNNDDGSSANGFVMVNELTGDYSITWNTSDPSLVSAHMNDGNVSGNSETVILALSQRPSNTAQFFAYGNFNDPNDQVPNLEALLSDGMAWLDAHSANDNRRFFGLLTKKDF